MKKIVLTAVISSLLIAFNSGCGLQIFQDWQNSEGKAMVGGGAVAGADYVNGLLPSEGAKKYFAKIPTDQQPIETVSRHDDAESKTGVRFVKNGGIVIPPGVTISYTNKGYCMDPHLPAPVANEEYQLVPMTRLIPSDLQGTYKKLLTKAANGDMEVQRNMQHLVWALRTAGSKDAYANNLTSAQKKILDRCSDYQGQFEEYHINSRKNQERWGALLGLADSVLNVKIGGVSYKASDLLDPDVGSKKINAHIDQLVSMGKSTPIERTGLNFGEIQPGIYTDVRGAGVLAYTAKIANSTHKEFIFYPQDYVGQVGSGTKSQGLTFFATASNGQKQRVTTNTDEVDIISRTGEICNYSSFDKVFEDSEMQDYNTFEDAENALKKNLEKKLKKTNEQVAVIYEERNSRGRITGYKVSTAVDTGSDCGFQDNSTYNAPYGRSYRKVAIGHTHGQPDQKYGNPYTPSSDDRSTSTKTYLLNPDGVWGDVNDPTVNWDPNSKGKKYDN